MALSSSQRKTIISRGYSAQQLAEWEKENPGDESRALAAFPTQSPSNPAPETKASAPPVTAPPPATVAPPPAPSTAPATAGLAGAAPMVEGAPAGGTVIGAETESVADAPTNAAVTALQALGPAVSGLGQEAIKQATPDVSGAAVLRQYLGTRTYPQGANPALAGLQRIY